LWDFCCEVLSFELQPGLSAPESTEESTMPKSGLPAFLIKELKEVVPPTVFFAVGFNLIVLTTNLILADYLASFAGFLVATVTALVVGKSVLVADALPLLRRFDTAPMIQTVLFKTSIYWAVVFLVRFLEKVKHVEGRARRQEPSIYLQVTA